MANPAWKVASDVAEGFLLISPVVLRRYQLHEVDALQKELEKLSRELRGTVVGPDDAEAFQAKNRKLLRISQATVVLQNHRSKALRA